MDSSVELKKANGEVFKAEIISFFELNDTKKRYLFYTLNETVENGLVKMYVSEVGENAILSSKMADEEWTVLKTIMKSMLTGNENTNIKYLKWEG